MTWVWIVLAVLGVAVCGLLLAVLVLVRRALAPGGGAATSQLEQPSPVVAATDHRADAGLMDQEPDEDRDAARKLVATVPVTAVERVDDDSSRQQGPGTGDSAAMIAERELTAARNDLADGERELAEGRRALAADRAALELQQARLTERTAQVERSEQAAQDRAAQERADLRELRAGLEAREQRLTEREERLLAEGRTIEARSLQLAELRERAEEQLRTATAQGEQALRSAQEQRAVAEAELQRIAGLDHAAARSEVLARVEHESRLEATALARDIEQAAVRDAEGRARATIVTAIQRLASEQTSESVVSTVELPGDEMKGRIIGREGRNIRHFEQVTGVNVMIDDTPGTVLLSCFDPVRREVGRLTLQELVADGRIHPARIEEVHERSRQRIEERCRRAAEDALAEVGISDMPDELVTVLGALRYRTSYGQNVLRHLVECAHLAGMMAAELGLDVALCTRAAFLHDIGKALTHEREGSHAMVGGELARRHGEDPEVVHAIEAHHNEVEPTSVVAVLTQAADAISGSRPGARRESLEAYVHRLERLEEIASAHPGVDRVFAMQAGREVRVMVSPDQLSDAESHALARDIARQVQTELTYPGQIRVTVVRESRATEVAH